MIFVQALSEGLLSHVGNRFLIRSLEEGRWKTDRGPVDVDPGLIVSLNNSEDRDHLLKFERKQPIRAQIPAVQEGEVLLFQFEEDVAALEAQGVLRRLTQPEIEQVVAQAQSGEPVDLGIPEGDPEPSGSEADDAAGDEKEPRVVEMKTRKPRGRKGTK